MNQPHSSQQRQAQPQQDGAGATGFAPIAVHPHHHQPPPPPPAFHPHQLMGLMSNPSTLVATAAPHPLFPPSSMLSNPGAFLALQPEAFGITAASATTTGGCGPLQSPNPFALPLLASKSPTFPTSTTIAAAAATSSSEATTADPDKQLTPAERAKQNRDRNREHARSTRMRKKAYVVKLKELVEGLHAERADEIRARRVAVQQVAEQQRVRRHIVRQFLACHAQYETDPRQWKTIVEEDFWLKQPVTPYRSFRRAEIEKECRMSRGIDAMICDAASMAVMTESIGSRSPCWMKIKRQDFTALEQSKRAPTKEMPRCIARQVSRLQHAISSLSSSEGDSSHHGSTTTDVVAPSSHHGTRRSVEQLQAPTVADTRPIMASASLNDKATTSTAMSVSSKSAGEQAAAAKVSSVSGSDSGHHRQQQSRNNNDNNNAMDASEDYHDYHAKPLPDPKLGYGKRSSPSEDSPAGDSNGKRAISGADSSSSSGDELAPPASKRRKTDSTSSTTNNTGAHHSSSPATVSDSKQLAAAQALANNLPPNIAKKGGISHNVRPQQQQAQDMGNGAARLRAAPAVTLPPFAGIGKKRTASSVASRTASEPSNHSVKSDTAVASKRNNTAAGSRENGGVLMPSKVNSVVVLATDNGGDSLEEGPPQITGAYHINDDDMVLMEDFLMCPFVFRSANAIQCGACYECVMPGMLRATFSSHNKLVNMEMIYDAMGFMQQLERASGNEGTAQIVAGSLEMALDPNAKEARVITLAKPPYLIVNVNEMWTRITGYTQMDVEGVEYLSLLQGEGTVPEAMERPGKPVHTLDEVAKGRPACSTNIHYDSNGRDFIEFVASYPLTNANDEITHILHVSKELPSYIE